MAWGQDLCVDCETLSLLRHPSSFSLGVSVGGSTVVRLVKTSSTTEQIYVRFSCVKARGTKDLWLCHPGDADYVFSSGIFAVIFSSPLRVAVASPVPLLVTTHPLRTSRSDETRTRSARRLVPVAPLSRLFPYPDFSDERSPSTPPTFWGCSALTTVSSRHPLSLPPQNIITPACLASELIYPPSPPQATLAPAAPFLRLLLVVFDCLRKLMPAINFREPKTVTMTLFCSAYLNIPYLSQVCTLVSRSPTLVGILCSYVVHIIIKRKPLITSVGYCQPFPNPLDRAPHCRFIFRLQYVLGNISFRVSSIS
ncbi:hypothetical protein HID58_071400 [Brassica napus]|uniref:Uncharacterized protein n=1 Tax=Brassica napus TaxID=3708 RepID=A0ABQ7Z1I6_BRANA|nr:hypothetical protein HID58_071400 [Brassica napus]